jgi:hypothetical protein
VISAGTLRGRMLKRNGLSDIAINTLFRDARNGKASELNGAITHAEGRGIRRITRYTLRYFMATRVRALREIKVDREQRSLWLGRGRKDETSWYESHDPEYLLEASQATTLIMSKLDELTRRPLVPESLRQRKLLTGLAIAK